MDDLSRSPLDVSGHCKRVLVVDDDELVARTVGELLSERFEVTVALSAPDALARLVGGEYDAVLSDYQMPQANGRDLFEEATRVWPHLRQRFVFMSGAAHTPDAHAFFAQIDNPVLRKPVELRLLIEALSLAASSPPDHVGH